MYKCPECENEINQATEVCPHCGTDLEALAAVALAAEPAKQRSTGKIVLIWVTLVVVVAVGLYAFIWYVLPERAGNQSRTGVEARVLESLAEFQTALENFARAENGRYPDSAEALDAWRRETRWAWATRFSTRRGRLARMARCETTAFQRGPTATASEVFTPIRVARSTSRQKIVPRRRRTRSFERLLFRR